MYFTTIQRAIYKYFLPDLVTFATELSTNLVYKSIFVIDYNYISIH